MNKLAVKDLGAIKSGTAINTGILASATGNYVFQCFQFGRWRNVTVAGTLGNELELPNDFNASGGHSSQ